MYIPFEQKTEYIYIIKTFLLFFISIYIYINKNIIFFAIYKLKVLLSQKNLLE